MLTSNVQLGYILTRDGGQAGQLAPHPSGKGNQTDIGCKHLSLAEIMFTSLTTKYSKIMVQ